jgi:uroporphyrinogen-III decarboxylase
LGRCRLVRRCLSVIVFHADDQLLQVFESNAGELAPNAFDEFSLAYLSTIVTDVKRRLRDLGVAVPPMVSS